MVGGRFRLLLEFYRELFDSKLNYLEVHLLFLYLLGIKGSSTIQAHAPCARLVGGPLGRREGNSL